MRCEACLRSISALTRQNTLVSTPTVMHCSAELSARSTCVTSTSPVSAELNATIEPPSASGKAMRLSAESAPSPSCARCRYLSNRSSSKLGISGPEPARNATATMSAAQARGSARHKASAPARFPCTSRRSIAAASCGPSTPACKLRTAARQIATPHAASPSNRLGQTAKLTALLDQNASDCTERTTSRTKLVRRSSTS